ncbi:fimbrial protein [Serratia sp. T13T92]|uniref:fimbrial protein n=1 Tax=Serratia sp. T13T92 TaxID=3397496 RepID=UPI0039E1ACE0
MSNLTLLNIRKKMKLNKIMMAVVLSLSTVSAAQAADGKITFTGSIIDAPCSISANTIDQTIELGAISNAALSANGNTGESTPRPVKISLENCVVTTTGAVTTADKVQVKFMGTPSTYDNDSLALSGGLASGAYIVLTGNDGNKVLLNTPTSPQQFVNGASPDLTFTARLKGGGAGIVIKPGSFAVPVEFQLSYL